MSDQQKITEFSQSAEQSGSVTSGDELDEFGWGSFGKPPEGWLISRVEDLFEIQKDSANPDELNKEELVRLYSMPAFDDGKEPKLTKAGDIGSKKFHVPNQALLFSKLNISKKRFWLVNHSHDEPALCSTEYWPLLPAEGVNLGFYLQYFNSDSFIDRPRLSTSSTTNSHQRIKSNLFDKVRLPVPPLPEQRKIATILHTVDRAIEKTAEIIGQKERIRTGLMQDIFTGSDVDSTKSVRLSAVDTEIPEHWKVKPVGEVSIQITDGAHLTPDRSEDGYLLLSARNVKNGYLDLSDVDYVPEEEYERLIEKCNPQPGNILISCSGTVGRVCEVPKDLEFALVRSAALVKFKNSILPSYAEKVLQSVGVQKQIMGYQTQSAQPNLFQGQIASLEIPIPPIEEQRDIAKKLDDVGDSISADQQYKSQLKRLKRGLMQDLLSGTVRTTDTNIEVPDEIAQYG